MKSLAPPSTFMIAVAFVFLMAVAAHAESESKKLVGTTWAVENIEGRAGIDYIQTDLTFETEMQMLGNGGCNHYLGTVKIDGNSIEFGSLGFDPPGASRNECGEAIDDQELKFFGALEKTRSFAFDNELLLLLGVDGKQLLQLRRID